MGDDLNAEGSVQQKRYNGPRNANYWAPLMRKRHHKENRLQRLSEGVDPTQRGKNGRLSRALL